MWVVAFEVVASRNFVVAPRRWVAANTFLMRLRVEERVIPHDHGGVIFRDAAAHLLISKPTNFGSS